MRTIGASGEPRLPQAAAASATQSRAAAATARRECSSRRTSVREGVLLVARLAIGRRTLAGFGSEAPGIDGVALRRVVEDAFGGVEQPRGFRAVAACGLERVLDEVALEGRHRIRQ